MVTFETKVYENDWEYVLKGNYLERTISHCDYKFKEKILYINNVKDQNAVRKAADYKVDAGVLDRYCMVGDFAEEALNYFNIKRDSFQGGYYYSIAELVGIYLCRTDYLLHFSSDAYPDTNQAHWIEQALRIFQRRKDVIVANPTWNFAYNEAKNESFGEIDDFHLGYGFSDQCYLVRMDVFKNNIYNETHIDSERYPPYGGQLFEKRVDSYMRNHELYRITHKTSNYIHRNFPKGVAVEAYIQEKKDQD